MKRPHAGTPVIFRIWKGTDDVIAIFPTIPGAATASHLCQSYEHVGQHGACDYRRAILPQTRLPKEDEWQGWYDLFRELKDLGYDDLVIYKRWQPWFNSARITEIRRMESALDKMHFAERFS